MGKLDKIASGSPLMEIKVKYRGKTYTFNLYEETQVNANTLNRDLKSHASSYAFLLQLRNSLEKTSMELEAAKEKTYNKLYLRYKKQNNPLTNRPMSDDAAKSKALASPIYQDAVTEHINALHNFKTLRDAIRAYEVRKELMQSLGANIRNEK